MSPILFDFVEIFDQEDLGWVLRSWCNTGKYLSKRYSLYSKMYFQKFNALFWILPLFLFKKIPLSGRKISFHTPHYSSLYYKVYLSWICIFLSDSYVGWTLHYICLMLPFMNYCSQLTSLQGNYNHQAWATKVMTPLVGRLLTKIQHYNSLWLVILWTSAFVQLLLKCVRKGRDIRIQWYNSDYPKLFLLMGLG